MKCHYCQGEMKKGTVPYHVDRHGYHLSFDGVPAFVCSQCGQSYFESHEIDEIQNTIKVLDERASKVLIAA
jgi:YgiT-type zinc finger domain-containing protein